MGYFCFLYSYLGLLHQSCCHIRSFRRRAELAGCCGLRMLLRRPVEGAMCFLCVKTLYSSQHVHYVSQHVHYVSQHVHYVSQHVHYVIHVSG
jgi:hypothetical protein